MENLALEIRNKIATEKLLVHHLIGLDDSGVFTSEFSDPKVRPYALVTSTELEPPVHWFVLTDLDECLVYCFEFHRFLHHWHPGWTIDGFLENENITIKFVERLKYPRLIEKIKQVVQLFYGPSLIGGP